MAAGLSSFLIATSCIVIIWLPCGTLAVPTLPLGFDASLAGASDDNVGGVNIDKSFGVSKSFHLGEERPAEVQRLPNVIHFDTIVTTTTSTTTTPPPLPPRILPTMDNHFKPRQHPIPPPPPPPPHRSQPPCDHQGRPIMPNHPIRYRALEEKNETEDKSNGSVAYHFVPLPNGSVVHHLVPLPNGSVVHHLVPHPEHLAFVRHAPEKAEIPYAEKNATLEAAEEKNKDQKERFIIFLNNSTEKAEKDSPITPELQASPEEIQKKADIAKAYAASLIKKNETSKGAVHQFTRDAGYGEAQVKTPTAPLKDPSTPLNATAPDSLNGTEGNNSTDRHVSPKFKGAFENL